MKRALPVVLVLIAFPLTCVLALFTLAVSRIGQARAEIERGFLRLSIPSDVPIPDRVRALTRLATLDLDDLQVLIKRSKFGVTPADLARCGDVGFDLRHQPFGIFGPPPPKPVGEMLTELEGARILGRRGGMNAALTRIAEERRFAHRLGSMNERGLVGRATLAELRLELERLESLREPIEEAFEVERLLLMREVLTLTPPEPGEALVIQERPGWRDLGSWTLLRARALEGLDRHFDQVRKVKAMPVAERKAFLEHHFAAPTGRPSLLAPWVLALEFQALWYQDCIDADMARFR